MMNWWVEIPIWTPESTNNIFGKKRYISPLAATPTWLQKDNTSEQIQSMMLMITMTLTILKSVMMTLLEAVPMSPDLLILLEAVAVTVNWLCLEGDTSLDTYPDSILKRMSHYHYDQVHSKSVIILGQKGFSRKKLIDYAISVFFWFSI